MFSKFVQKYICKCLKKKTYRKRTLLKLYPSEVVPYVVLERKKSFIIKTERK